MGTRVVTKAPAKINLTLEVVGKLSNGFHRIRSVLVKLDELADVIDIRIGGSGADIKIGSDAVDLPLDERNICHQAVRSYLRATGKSVGVRIHIQKRIPIAAGLGGGSSDAACVLIALNKHFRKRVPAEDLNAIGSDLGKDIPFFLGSAKAGLATEAGDKVDGLPALPARARFLIVNPRIPISTKEAYESVGRNAWFMAHEDRADLSRRMAEAIASKDIARIAGGLYNDFEAVGERDHPSIKEIKQALLAFGACGALMSGSGSSVFGLFDSKKGVLAAEAALRTHYRGFIIEKG